MRKDNNNWSASLSKLRSAPSVRNPVREERLKTTSLHYGASVLPLSAWRGGSGRRYVVGVHAVSAVKFLIEDETGSVVILAVRRPEVGEALILDARDAVPGAVRSWLDAVIASGATELHVHRLADDASERAAILDDLLGEASRTADASEPDAAA